MTHKSRPPHEDPAFLRPKVTEFYEQNGDVVMRTESGVTVVFKPNQRIQLGSCRPVVDVVDVDLIKVQKVYFRAKLLSEARDCWEVFFANSGTFELNWHLVDAAQSLERRAAEIAP